LNVRAVLFDVGGPLNTEFEHERLIDADILAVLAGAGIDVTPQQYTAAVDFAVHAYAPDAHPAIIWHATLEVLDRHGIGRFFHHREVSGTHGYRKPDPRLFLRCCEDLGVQPEACIMIGDRIDNDVAPAKLLGMRAVLFRTGRHAAQQPRSHDELPDAEVRTPLELRRALEVLLDE